MCPRLQKSLCTGDPLTLSPPQAPGDIGPPRQAPRKAQLLRGEARAKDAGRCGELWKPHRSSYIRSCIRYPSEPKGEPCLGILWVRVWVINGLEQKSPKGRKVESCNSRALLYALGHAFWPYSNVNGRYLSRDYSFKNQRVCWPRKTMTSFKIIMALTFWISMSHGRQRTIFYYRSNFYRNFFFVQLVVSYRL